MRKNLFTAVFLSLALFSCKAPGNEPAVSPGTPLALQERSKSSEIGFSKSRYDDDLVESLYAELADMNPDLKEFEKTIGRLPDQKSDSLKAFSSFDARNTSYYNSTQGYLKLISDSVLRVRLITMIDNSLNSYNEKVAKHKDLIAIIGSKDVSLQNLYTVLKLVKTLPIMEKYQVENMPSIKPIEGISYKLDKTIYKADSLSKF